MSNYVVRLLLGFCCLMLFAVQPALGQSSAEFKTLQAEIRALKSGQLAIQKSLRELRTLLQVRRTPPRNVLPPNLVLNIGDDPFKGEKNARVTLVEFSDYQCPFCSRFFRQTLPRLEREYLSSGKVKYVFRDFPIERIHPQAFKAAEAANCADEQGKYWLMHDKLFQSQRAMGLDKLPVYAETLGLDRAAFEQCLKSGKYVKEIRSDMAEGRKSGVRGTPTFFLGITEPDKTTLKVTKMIRGARPYASFKEAIDSLLSRKSPTKKN